MPESVVTSSLRGKCSLLVGKESRSRAGRFSEVPIKLTTGEILSRAERRSLELAWAEVGPGGVIRGSLTGRERGGGGNMGALGIRELSRRSY